MYMFLFHLIFLLRFLLQVHFFKSDKEFLDSVDECGNTSLHLAARNGHLVMTATCTVYMHI